MAYTIQHLPPFVRGDDWTLKITLTSNDVAIDITDYVYWMTLKADVDTPDPGDLQVTAIPLTPQDAANGIVYIVVPRSLTEPLEADTYHYDVQQVDNLGNVQTLLMGKVKVVKDVTRSY